MLVGAFYIFLQFNEHCVVLVRHFLHLFGLDDLCIGLVGFHNDLRCRQRFAQLCHFFAQ